MSHVIIKDDEVDIVICALQSDLTSFMENWRPFFSRFHLIIVKDPDLKGGLIIPEGFNLNIYTKFDIDKVVGPSLNAISFSGYSCRYFGYLMSRKKYIISIDDDCFPAKDTNGKPIDAISQHITNLTTPATPFFFNTLYDPTKRQIQINEKKSVPTSNRTNLVADQRKTHSSDTQVLNNPSLPNDNAKDRPNPESAPKKVTVEFGEPGTSDFKVMLLGKQGLAVKLSVHRRVLMESSSFFWSRISEQQLIFPCLEIDNCEDVEIYVETIGLMYCKELKQRLMKQSVPRVLRILKVGEQLGFSTCIQSCLEYLEAVPWVGEEEEKVVSSILSLEAEGIKVKPVLKRVSSDTWKPPNDTLSHILELVLKSKDEKGRREMKSMVLKLLKENNAIPNSSSSSDLCNGTLYNSCKTSLDYLLSLFKQAADPNFADKTIETREPVSKSIALESDNLLWLLDILVDRQSADEFALIWANQGELVNLHARIAIMSRFHVSMISSRLFVGIGRGEILPCKDTRHLLLRTWLEPLINDYRWLQHGVRSFDRTVVEEGIGRTILTLPLEDQRTILVSWLGNFLKAGDSNCPNLQKAFEVWWRRTFVRSPYVESGNVGPSAGGVMTWKVEE